MLLKLCRILPRGPFAIQRLRRNVRRRQTLPQVPQAIVSGQNGFILFHVENFSFDLVYLDVGLFEDLRVSGVDICGFHGSVLSFNICTLLLLLKVIPSCFEPRAPIRKLIQLTPEQVQSSRRRGDLFRLLSSAQCRDLGGEGPASRLHWGEVILRHGFFQPSAWRRCQVWNCRLWVIRVHWLIIVVTELHWLWHQRRPAYLCLLRNGSLLVIMLCVAVLG